MSAWPLQVFEYFNRSGMKRSSWHNTGIYLTLQQNRTCSSVSPSIFNIFYFNFRESHNQQSSSIDRGGRYKISIRDESLKQLSPGRKNYEMWTMIIAKEVCQKKAYQIQRKKVASKAFLISGSWGTVTGVQSKRVHCGYPSESQATNS